MGESKKRCFAGQWVDKTHSRTSAKEIILGIDSSDSPTLGRKEDMAKTGSGLIQALMPRGQGHHFVVYSDCCSGIPDTPREENFRRVNHALARLTPMPNFILFPGDHIRGLVPSREKLVGQWRYWLDKEMSWLDPSISFYHTTSNHNTYSEMSEQVFREIFPQIPQNGPPDQKGLSYFIRNDDLLMVLVNTSFSRLGGNTHVEYQWLDNVLTQNDDARYKLVIAHYPAYPVNGYETGWVIVPEEREPFWEVLVRHKVLAYICSHIIAYDVQVRQGVLQILSGGAGTDAGPGYCMPGQTEYYHFCQFALDRQGLHWQVVNDQGKILEKMDWPLKVPDESEWAPFSPDGEKALLELNTAQQKHNEPFQKPQILFFRFRGRTAENAGEQDQVLLSGWELNPMEGPPTVWIGLDGLSRLIVRLVPEQGSGSQIWKGPKIETDQPFDFQLAIHVGMGPGGIIWRQGDQTSWSSLDTTSSRGAERLAWPQFWDTGKGPLRTGESVFKGLDLQVDFTLVADIN